MAPPVSLELCERIIAWRYELHISISDIMRLSSRCEKTVHNILKSFRENDNLFGHPVIERRGHKRLLDRDDLNYLESILRAEPGLFLDEVQQNLRIVRDIEVSITTICRTLNRLAITHKHIAKEAAERNEHLRATWQVSMAQYDPCQLVFVDEDDRRRHVLLITDRTDGKNELGVRNATVNKVFKTYSAPSPIAGPAGLLQAGP
jgi:transposase